MKKMMVTGMIMGSVLLAMPSLSEARADLKGEVPKPTSFCWTGIYLGGNLGGKWGRFNEAIRMDVSRLGFFFLPPDRIVFNNWEKSFTGGAQIGYNQQFTSMLLGAEADLNAMYLNARNTVGDEAFQTINYTPNDHFRIRSYWQSSLRARAGYVWENWLLYLTGGLAFTDVKITGDFVPANNGVLTVPEASGYGSRVLLGGTVGIGTEYALMDHWSVGGEYRYTSYQTKSVHLASVPILAVSTPTGTVFSYTPVTAKFRLFTNEVLFKVNYNFA
jgi:outer membrane immunogenic protein